MRVVTYPSSLLDRLFRLAFAHLKCLHIFAKNTPNQHKSIALPVLGPVVVSEVPSFVLGVKNCEQNESIPMREKANILSAIR